jgi:hypothetical protein
MKNHHSSKKCSKLTIFKNLPKNFPNPNFWQICVFLKTNSHRIGLRTRFFCMKIVREMGESVQLNFAPKIFGWDFKSANFWLDNARNSPKLKKNRPQILGRNLTAWTRPFSSEQEWLWKYFTARGRDYTDSDISYGVTWPFSSTKKPS